MSIRLRFILLYNAILALTLGVFGLVLYSIQARTTYTALQQDILRSSGRLSFVLERSASGVTFSVAQPPPYPGGPVPFQNFSSDPSFQALQEREIVRILDPEGNLIASPFGSSADALPMSDIGLQALQGNAEWWESTQVDDQQMLIFSRPVTINGELALILQIARPLTERNRSLQALALSLVGASLVILVLAVGIGWVLSGITLAPIQRITSTARAIGEERDLARRVVYQGPQDEVGHLATTFNSMLARLQEAYQQVEHALELQRNFVADVSHELRTPLTTLRGNLGLLRRGAAIPAEEQSDILSDMVDESDRLIRLVNDLLMMARADAQRDLTLEAIEVQPILEDATRQVGQMETDRQIEMHVEPGLRLMGDRDASKQVILCALDNAIKHSSGVIHVRAERIGEQVEVRVQDQGEGIPPEKLERVFDRFFRGDERSGQPGFGLGLSIAKALVEAQGGTVEMQSKVGVGSVLVMRFRAPKMT